MKKRLIVTGLILVMLLVPVSCAQPSPAPAIKTLTGSEKNTMVRVALAHPEVAKWLETAEVYGVEVGWSIVSWNNSEATGWARVAYEEIADGSFPPAKLFPPESTSIHPDVLIRLRNPPRMHIHIAFDRKTMEVVAVQFLERPATGPTPTPAPAPEVEKETPPMTVEEGKELAVESWKIGENWRYSRQAIWGDVMTGWEIEQQRGHIVWQSISTYDLRSREKQRVLEVPATFQVGPISIHKDRIVWASVDRDEAEQQRSLKRAPLPNWDVFLLDLKTGEVQQLTTEEHAQVYPKIYGDTVVWLDNRYEEGYHNPRRYDVYAYDLNTGEERRLTSATSAEGMDLAVNGNLVVWTDNRHADPEVNSHPENDPEYNNEIYVYDLTTNQEKRITTNPGNDRYPDISGSNIVWLRQEDYIRADVFVHNVETSQETQVSYSSYADFYPSIHGNRIVWTDARVSKGNTSGDTVINGRQGQTDIYLYDLKTQQEIQLTSTEPGKVLYNPVTHGDSVVYVWVSMISSIVYGMHLTYQ